MLRIQIRTLFIWHDVATKLTPPYARNLHKQMTINGLKVRIVDNEGNPP